MDRTLEPVFRVFGSKPVEYESLARLLNAVWPDQPTTATWLHRFDHERDEHRPIRRIVAESSSLPGQFLGMAETGPARWSDLKGHYELALAVHPQARLRGLGSHLWRQILEIAADGATMAEGATREDQPEAIEFLVRRGCHRVARNAISELDLRKFDPGAWGPELKRAVCGGIRIQQFPANPTARESWLPGMWHLTAETLPDAPGQAAAVAPPFDVWRRSFTENNPDFLPEATMIAFDGERTVGMTQIWASEGSNEILYTGFTGVDREYRRRGLATALKVRSLGAVLSIRPSATTVRTGNEETNPMLAINRHLGFVARPATLIYRLRMELDGPTQPKKR